MIFAGPKRGRPTGGFLIPVQVITPLSHFKLHSKVCPYLTNLFSCVLLGQYTSDPQYFYRFRTPYKNDYKGGQNIFWGVITDGPF